MFVTKKRARPNYGYLDFGLGEQEGIDKFTVHWPSGEREQFPGAAANGRYLLVEGSGSVKPLPAKQ